MRRMEAGHLGGQRGRHATPQQARRGLEHPHPSTPGHRGRRHLEADEPSPDHDHVGPGDQPGAQPIGVVVVAQGQRQLAAGHAQRAGSAASGQQHPVVVDRLAALQDDAARRPVDRDDGDPCPHQHPRGTERGLATDQRCLRTRVQQNLFRQRRALVGHSPLGRDEREWTGMAGLTQPEGGEGSGGASPDDDDPLVTSSRGHGAPSSASC